MLIFTTKGDIEESLLVRSEEITENDNELTKVVIHTLEGEVVKREVTIELKQPISAGADISSF